jgi:hypothetical protein
MARAGSLLESATYGADDTDGNKKCRKVPKAAGGRAVESFSLRVEGPENFTFSLPFLYQEFAFWILPMPIVPWIGRKSSPGR